MKFFYPDSLDTVDPAYDFENDAIAEDRIRIVDEVFAHEILSEPPYDGLLVSRTLMGVRGSGGRYTDGQAMRFMREGARRFLRLEESTLKEVELMGDCGAFAYHKDPVPPYTPAEMFEFYEYGGFTQGCSVDHIIFEYGDDEAGSEEAKRRFEITLDLADEFMRECCQQKATFEPIGVVQGWSPESMMVATRALVKMGYRYIAIGGLVPLRIDPIREALRAVHSIVKDVADAKIHLLGFGKERFVTELKEYKVASFDSTSPLLRAFKDNKKNYWYEDSSGEIDGYSALRIPQTDKNLKLQRRIKKGEISQEVAIVEEKQTLEIVRAFDNGKASLDETLNQVLKFSRYMIESESLSEGRLESTIERLRQDYEATLSSNCWKKCTCSICRDLSIEVVVFRGSNRNKRRGMHNLGVFSRQFKKRLNGSPAN